MLHQQISPKELKDILNNLILRKRRFEDNHLNHRVKELERIDRQN